MHHLLSLAKFISHELSHVNDELEDNLVVTAMGP